MTLTQEQTYLLTAFSSHVGWALAAAFIVGLFGIPLWVGLGGIMLIAVLKEMLVDPYLEGNPFWNGSWDSGAGDLVGYVVGVGAVVLILCLVWLI